jgi:signal peptidase I
MKISKWILGIGVALISIAVLFKANHCVVVTGYSMSPTFHNLQVLSYNPKGAIVKHCVVVFKRDNETLIKRVAEVPGDFYELHVEPDGRRWPLYLNKDEYFVEGDNQNSEDSWMYGIVTKDQILGVIYNVPMPKDWNQKYFAYRENLHPRSILKPTIKLIRPASYYRIDALQDNN